MNPRSFLGDSQVSQWAPSCLKDGAEKQREEIQRIVLNYHTWYKDAFCSSEAMTKESSSVSPFRRLCAFNSVRGPGVKLCRGYSFSGPLLGCAICRWSADRQRADRQITLLILCAGPVERLYGDYTLFSEGLLFSCLLPLDPTCYSKMTIILENQNHIFNCYDFTDHFGFNIMEENHNQTMGIFNTACIWPNDIAIIQKKMIFHAFYDY